MARTHGAMRDEDLDEFEAAMERQADELHEALAEDLGGDPEDYDPSDRADEPVPHRGDED